MQRQHLWRFQTISRSGQAALLSVLLTVSQLSCTSKQKVTQTSQSPTVIFSQPAVVSFHPLATQIGQTILANGGNAFDAFVAVTAAEYVLSEGVTSLGGPLNALVYEQKSNKTYYLDANFNAPLDPEGKWQAGSPKFGRAARVPGAPAGLAAISQRFGRIRLRRALKPAIDLARTGFTVTPELNHQLKLFESVIKRSEYGRATYFPHGKILDAGQTLKLPEVAAVLERLGQVGTGDIYHGEWARQAVIVTRSQGSLLTAEDFAKYEARWLEPLKVNYRGVEISAPSGKAYGGLANTLALKAFESAPPLSATDQELSSGELNTLVRIESAAQNKAEVYALSDPAHALLDPGQIQKSIAGDANQIWLEVSAKKKNVPAVPIPSIGGDRGYNVVVIDREGNAITGTNTIESHPFGDGLFVQGIAFSAAGSQPFYTAPGERELSPASMDIGVKDGRVLFALGAFADAPLLADFRAVVDIIDLRLSPNVVAGVPKPAETVLESDNGQDSSPQQVSGAKRSSRARENGLLPKRVAIALTRASGEIETAISISAPSQSK